MLKSESGMVDVEVDEDTKGKRRGNKERRRRKQQEEAIVFLGNCASGPKTK